MCGGGGDEGGDGGAGGDDGAAGEDVPLPGGTAVAPPSFSSGSQPSASSWLWDSCCEPC